MPEDATQETIHTRVERERKAAFPNPSVIRRFRAYYRGQQRGTLTKEQISYLRGVVGNPFCDNACSMTVNAAANRLELVRYDVYDVPTLEFLRDLWTFNSMADMAGEAHIATLRDGNHVILLDWYSKDEGNTADGRVRLARERWWDGKSGFFVGYDDYAMPAYGVKEWSIGAKHYRTIYLPGEIQKYVRDGGGWKPRVAAEGDAWPIYWTRTSAKNGEPIGLPFAHFANGSDDDTPYGASSMDGGMLGLQDDTNEIQRDITAAARKTAYQVYWASGIELADDPARPGHKLALNSDPGVWVTALTPDARFGALPAGDITQLELALQIKLEAISRLTSTPLHMIGGSWPSGEALYRAEMPLIEKVMSLGKTLGPAWSSLAHKATVLANTFSSAGLNEDELISSVFADPNRRDPLTLAQVAAAQAPFVSEREVLRLLGKTKEQQDQILEERRTEDVIASPSPFGSQGSPLAKLGPQPGG